MVKTFLSALGFTLWQLVLWLDQGFNVVTLGYCDELFSARCHRMQGKSRAWKRTRNLVNAIFFWQEDHCRGAFLAEMRRWDLPQEYRLAPESTARSGSKVALERGRR